MTVEERMQMIRLLDLIERHPNFARELGLEWEDQLVKSKKDKDA